MKTEEVPVQPAHLALLLRVHILLNSVDTIGYVLGGHGTLEKNETFF